jgi:hypothetical protein
MDSEAGDVIDGTALRAPNLTMHTHIHIVTKLIKYQQSRLPSWYLVAIDATKAAGIRAVTHPSQLQRWKSRAGHRGVSCGNRIGHAVA